MTYYRLIRTGVMFGAVFGATLLTISKASAQDKVPPLISPPAQSIPPAAPSNEQEKAVGGGGAGGGILDKAARMRTGARVDFENALNDDIDSRVIWKYQSQFTALSRTSEKLGARLEPIGDTLRAQLNIQLGQGLVVAALRSEGACAQAGIEANDILLSLGGKPLAAADDVFKHLQAAGDEAVPLSLLRAGKPITFQVRPLYHVTLGRVTEQKIEYYMGVSLETADNALRAQLALPAGRGIVVSDVTSGSPAEKAGIKKHDIVLELGGKHVDSQQTLAGLVQAAKDQPTTLKVLRSGQTTVIPITGAARKVAISAPREDLRAFVVDPVPGAALYRYKLATLQPPVRDLSGTISPDLQVRLDHLEKELKALRESLDKIDAALKAEKAKKRE